VGGLDVTIIPGGPQTNGALLLLYGKLEFYMGSDMIGNFLSAETKVPLIAVAADFQKSPQALMSHPGVGMDKWEDLPRAKPVYLGAAAINTFYAWLKLEYGFKDENVRPYNFNSAPSSRTRIRSSRATSPASPSRSKGKAISCQTYSCSPTTAMTRTRP
jgi:NitT/TauT family transport system substrate-binding protein